MLRDVVRLTTLSEVLFPLILLELGLMSGVPAMTAFTATAERAVVSLVIAAVFLAAVLSSLLRVAQRHQKLSEGRCPNPLCHGVVQPSQRVGPDQVVCPTCKQVWPRIEGMRFRLTSRV